jgi:hypothetical protein
MRDFFSGPRNLRNGFFSIIILLVQSRFQRIGQTVAERFTVTIQFADDSLRFALIGPFLCFLRFFDDTACSALKVNAGFSFVDFHSFVTMRAAAIG